tara:strand:+ start:913 stop:2637 length:1725 start_codon:yes stop_codon:yes gene_type:complete
MTTIERNITNVVNNIKNEFKDIKYTNDQKKTTLNNHQYLIKTFFNNIKFNDSKGMLLYHKMGTGKSILSISIAFESNKNIIIFTMANLISGFTKDIKKYLNNIGYENIEEFINNKVKFVSLNSYNMRENIGDINNSFIIVDEAHHLSTGVVNGSKNYIQLYYTIRNANDISLLLLTGTPIINDAFELIILFNLLVNKINIFNENYYEFDSFFTQLKKSNEILYRTRLKKLRNRIYGLSSVYEQPMDDNYPKDLGTEVVKCQMTNNQIVKYMNYKKLEDKSKNFNPNFSGGISKNSNKSSYRIKTRMICNIDPEEPIMSCIKYNNIYENILKNNGCCMVYSQFINNYGLLSFVEFIKQKGYTLYDKVSKNINSYAIIKGDIAFSERSEIQNSFNSPDNNNGNIIRILLVSSTGAEGLDLKYIKSVHIMEPYWNMSRVEQIKFRAIRYRSHEIFKPEDRTVKTYIYLSYMDQKTTDEDIYDIAKRKQNDIDDYLDIIKKSSIDCFFYYNDCMTCDVNNLPLFKINSINDLNLPDPCDSKNTGYKEIDIEKVGDYYIDKKNNKKYKVVSGVYVEVKN